MAFVKPGSATMNGESLWSRLAGLALIVEGCEYDRLHAMLAYEFKRVTTQVRLVGAGTDGLGEDVSVFREEGTALHETRPARIVNVKPSRIGSLRRLFDVYARCARERRPMYGGGMAELGVGRGQIELLAALFHADAGFRWAA
jgi:hypothetical protein